MSKETNTKAAEEKKLTAEELEASRKKAISYYTKQTEVLTAQAKYEKVLAEIEQSRAMRLEMIIRQAQMQAGPEPEVEETEPPPAPEPKERKLKTV